MHTDIRANEPSEFWCELPLLLQISKNIMELEDTSLAVLKLPKILSTAMSEIMTL